MVVYKLIASASTWWERIRATCMRYVELTINSWAWMGRLMFDHFSQSDYQQTLFKQCHHFQQGNRTIADMLMSFKNSAEMILMRVNLRKS